MTHGDVGQASTAQNLVNEGDDAMETSNDFSGAMPDVTFVVQSPSQMGPYAPPGGASQDYGTTNPTALPDPHPRPIWPSTSEVAAEYRHILAARQGQEASSNIWGNGASAGPPPFTRVSGTAGELVMGHNDRNRSETGTAASAGLDRLNQSRY